MNFPGKKGRQGPPFTAENTESVSMKTPQELQCDNRLIQKKKEVTLKLYEALCRSHFTENLLSFRQK